MNPETIRKVDRWLGVPMAAALSAHRVILRRLGRERAAQGPIRKIMFIKMTEQGATLLAYRAIEEAIARVGRESVYFWTFEENRAILESLRMLPAENLLCVRSKNPVHFVRDALRVLKQVRVLGIDATIDLEQFTRAPAILAYVTGATRRVGLHRFTSEGPYRGDLMTHRVQYNAYVHTSKLYYALALALFSDPDELPLIKEKLPDRLGGTLPQVEPTPEELQRVQGILDLAAGRPVNRPLVLLNPNASDLLPLRKWPSERFAQLARRILEAHSEVDIAFTGGPNEQDAVNDVVRQVRSERAFSVAGRTSLRDLFVLYTMADVLVTNDSGPAHFASMTNINLIALFGPETPLLYGPLGPRSQVAWAGLACSPCVNVFNHRFSPCKNNLCMQAITADEIYDRVADCLFSLTPSIARLSGSNQGRPASSSRQSKPRRRRAASARRSSPGDVRRRARKRRHRKIRSLAGPASSTLRSR